MSAFLIPEQTIGFAKQAVDESHAAAMDFLNRRPMAESVEPHGKPGYFALKIRLNEPIPTTVVRRVTEAIDNLRNAFDQILYAAAADIDNPFRKDAHFPWRESPEELEGLFKSDKCKIPPDLWDVIRRQEPYPRGQAYTGGDDTIRALTKIANRKHTVGLAVGIEPSSFEMVGTHRFDQNIGDEFFFMGPNWDSVKKETIVAISNRPEIDFKRNYRVDFCITFDEAGSVENVPFQMPLRAFLEKAQDCLESFKLECAAINHRNGR